MPFQQETFLCRRSGEYKMEKPVCTVRPRTVNTRDVVKLPVEGSKHSVVKMSSNTSSHDTQNIHNEMVKRKKTRKRRRTLLIRGK